MSGGSNGLRFEISPDGAVLPSTCFPSPSALGCSFDRNLVQEIGAAIAYEAREAGVGLLLAPVLNIKRVPLGGRNFEYYSEDPYLCGELAAAAVNGIQSQGVGACIGRYAVHNQQNARYTIDARLDKSTLHDIYLEAFRIAIKKSQPMAVMCSHNKVNGCYVTESEHLIREVLRNRFGFEGTVISDWGSVSDRTASFVAGLDLEMPGKSKMSVAQMLNDVNEGNITQQQLDEAVIHILDLMLQIAQMSGKPSVPFKPERAQYLAQRAAIESAVLLKNDDNLLPFTDNRPFAVIGLAARFPRIQAMGTSRVHVPVVKNISSALWHRGLNMPTADGYNADGSTNDQLVGEAKRLASEMGRAVIFCGLPENEELEGCDRSSYYLSDGVLKLIDVVSSVCPETVVYLMTGSPVALPFASRVQAIFWGNLGGQAASEAAADLLTGRASPGGRLAESWPVRINDLPAMRAFGKNRRFAEYREGPYVGYRYFISCSRKPLFPFGHGLTYTDFSIDNIASDSSTLAPGERMLITARVCNTGSRAGYAVLQLYAGKKGKPLRCLKGFEKIHLQPGQSSYLCITLDIDSFSSYCAKTDSRTVERGEYTLYIGTSSTDITETMDITVWVDEHRQSPNYPSADELESMDNEAFYSLLGYTPTEHTSRPFTLDSTLGELQSRTFGKIARTTAENMILSSDKDSQEVLLSSLDDIPVRLLTSISRGGFSRGTAESIVHFANYEFLKGIAVTRKK